MIIPIIDGHNDTINNVYFKRRPFLKETKQGHVDFPRAKKGGLIGAFFAISVLPEDKGKRQFGYGLKIVDKGWEVLYPSPLKQHYAEQFTDEVFNSFLSYVKQSKDISIVTNYKNLEECIEKDIFSIILHFEGAEIIKEDLSNLEYYYEKGLRSLGLVWSRANVFGCGVPFKYPSHPDIGTGLTNAGKNLVRKCNELGIIVDLAHINKKGFFDVASISKAPLVVSHAGVHSICNTATNLIDSQISAIKRTNGVVGIIFDVLNTRPDAQFMTNTSLDIILRHIDYIVNKIGIDHVCLGSDFDGGQMPNKLKDVSKLQGLINMLKKNGYSNEELEKIAYKNWLRVIKDSWSN
ncbi:MAG: membrane dipeptidase [Bacteroidetes bacterium]|nr:membrane dipeptidase [Bacteroidota bacterium]